MLKDANIPIPDGFDSTKQSYTLRGPEEESSSIGILFGTQIIYKLIHILTLDLFIHRAHIQISVHLQH